MAVESDRLEYWRKYFRSANASVFDVIEQAIHVAAADSPAELRRQRDRIAVVLFSSHLPVCHGCDNPRIPEEEEENEEEEETKERGLDCRKSARFDQEDELGNNPVVSNYSYDEAEALTEEIEEESQTIEEVLRIKELLFHKEDESDAVLFESLRRLQLMAPSVEILKVTEIGKAVNGLRKHSSKQIRALVRTLIEGWKILVDQWVSTAMLTESTPESVNPSVVEEDEGLPSPPLDDGILFSAQSNLELSQFFDGMDDDGNIQASRNSCEDRNGGIKPATRQRVETHGENSKRKSATPPACRGPQQDDLRRQADRFDRFGKEGQSLGEFSMGRSKKQEAECRQNKMSISGSATGPGRPQKSDAVGKGPASRTAVQQQEPVRGSIPKKFPLADHQEKSKNAEEMSVRVKLEAAKRKLHEGYQQAENAKKQRTIQVMELQDIPRHGHGSRQPSVKQGSLSRLRATHGRR
ncbi:transcription elongation factor (TFIIS) family protein [Wolffia australiana]